MRYDRGGSELTEKHRNVQVTLQILEALIEKAPRDLPLYARNVFKILSTIMNSSDITMVEASIPTFSAFCLHHDGASLLADQEYLKQYEGIVRKYASFASTRPQDPVLATSAPVAMKWRVAGLKAVKSVASSPALSSVAGRQLDTVMPILLENLWSSDPDYLPTIFSKAHLEEKVDTEKLLRRRGSMATVRTHDTSFEQTNPLALSGSTADADKLDSEDISVLAIQCLKQIFVVDNHAQIRGGTLALIDFIVERVQRNELVYKPSKLGEKEDKGWATGVFLMVARWTPVQERYTVLVTAMERLVRSQLTEESVRQELVLAMIIRALLRSDINLIGLSVMDVLLGLIQHILRLLQLSGAKPHLQPTYAVGLDGSPIKEMSPAQSVPSVLPTTEIVDAPSKARIDLLNMLEQCIGDLATHVYYADQIADMITAILARLKPPTNATISSANAIDDPQRASDVVLASGNLTENNETDSFFSFDTAKVIALSAIKNIILVATKRSKMVGATLGRNRVNIRVWESTQWLLRDPDFGVRKAYADALLTWLDREVTAEDAVVADDKLPAMGNHRTLLRTAGDESTTSMRDAGGSPTHEKKVKTRSSKYLELLHLAIYENALQYADSEADIALLHLLLCGLVNKLGINAVKSGLPMIFRLQEDIQEVETVSKVGLGSLCHGYFWALSSKFLGDETQLGQEIHAEVERRENKGLWVKLIKVPPARLGELEQQRVQTPHESELEGENLTPFDNREQLVELITANYTKQETSLAMSPAQSPRRSFSHGNHGGAHGHGILDIPPKLVPPHIKELMLSEWSKEAVLESASHTSKSDSLNGSKTGTNGTLPGAAARNYLSVNGQNGSAIGGGHHSRSRPPSQAYGLVGHVSLSPAHDGIPEARGVRGISRLRHTSGPVDQDPSESSKASITRVDHLKRILTGTAPPSRGIGTRGQSSSSGESMMSYQSDFSADRSRTDANSPLVDRARSRSRQRKTSTPVSNLNDGREGERERERAGRNRPLSSHPPGAATFWNPGPQTNTLDSVPPIPPLPQSLAIGQIGRQNPALTLNSDHFLGMDEGSGLDRVPTVMTQTSMVAQDGRYASEEGGTPELTLREYLRNGRSRSRGRESGMGKSIKSSKGGSMGRHGAGGPIDLGALLNGVSLKEKERGSDIGGMIEPPY